MIFGIFVLLRVIMCVVTNCNTTTTTSTSTTTTTTNSNNKFKVVKVTRTISRPKVKSTQTPTKMSGEKLNPTKTPKIKHSNIPVASGNSATLTYFTDTVFQCTNEEIPEYAVAVNPLLLGFTLDDWNNKYSGANSEDIPWCGKMIRLKVNNKTFTARIIDTCNPGDGGTFVDPNTGAIIGGKCDYTNVIDLHGETGRSFLQSSVGDDFYQGDLEWEII